MRATDSWVADTGGDGTSLASVAGALAAQAEACGAGPRGLKISVHSEGLNSEDLARVPWDATTRRLMRVAASRGAVRPAAAATGVPPPTDQQLAKANTLSKTKEGRALFI